MLEQWIRSLSWRGPRGSCGRWWHAPPGGAAIEDLEERFRKLKLRVEMLRLLIVAEEDEEERVVRIRSVERSPESGAVAPTRGGRIPASLEVFQCDAEKQHPEGFIRRLVAQLTVAQVPQDRWPAILAIQVRGSAEGWAQRVLLDAPSWEEAKELFLRRFLLPQDELRRREELYALRQRDGESVLQYASRLEDALAAAGMESEGTSAMALFQKGLVGQLRGAYVTAVSMRAPFHMSEAVSVARGLEAALPKGGATKSSDMRARGACYLCHGQGHFASKCPQRLAGSGSAVPPRTGGARAPSRSVEEERGAADASRYCYVCDDADHIARACPRRARPELRKPVVQAVLAERLRLHTPVMGDADGVSRGSEGSVQESVAAAAGRERRAVEEAPVEASPLLLSAGTVNGVRVMLIVDSAAQVSCVDRNWLDQHGIAFHRQPSSVRAAGVGNRLEVHGDVSLAVCHGTKEANLKCMVVDLEGSNPVIVGVPHLEAIGVTVQGLQVAFPASANAAPVSEPREWTPVSVPEEYVAPEDVALIAASIERELLENQSIPVSRLCSYPGCEVQLETTKPVPYIRQYDIPQKYRAEVDETVKRWAEEGVTEAAAPDAQSNLSLTAGAKKDLQGNKTGVRVCLDARPLNADLPDDRVPIPLVRDVFERVRGFAVCSRLDLAQGYHQLPVRASDRHKLTFTWERRRWRFRGAPFGVKHLSSHFQRVMSAVLAGTEEFVAIFIDDVFVFSPSVQEHIEHLKIVIGKLSAHHLTLRAAKCAFGLRRAELLGHVVEADVLRPLPQKLSCVLQMKRPESSKQMQIALGLINYLRAFIPRASMICAPLARAAVASVFSWTDECEAAWQEVRAVLSAPPVLHAPARDVPFVIGTDASQMGVGASLFQEVDGQRRYVAFASKSLTGAQCNYPATKRELLAVVFALDRFRRWVLGTHFTVLTDHRALTFLMSQRGTKSYILQNWYEQLMEYSFDVVHAPGTSMVVEDALSRLDAEVACVALEGVAGASVDADPVSEEEATVEERARRRGLVTRCHALTHAGAEGMVRILREEGYYWRGMRAACVEVARECERCRAMNPGKRMVHELTPILATMPFDHVSMDLFGPLPVSEDGFLYALVVVDVATRYVILRPLRSKTAEEVAGCLASVITEYGAPKIVQSDNGREFKNRLLRALTVACGMDQRFVQPYHPRANGLSEAAVKVVKALLFKLLEGDFQRWHTRLHAVQYALNNRVMLRTGMKPFTLFFGRPPNEFADYAEVEVSEVDLRALLDRVRLLCDKVWPTSREYAEGRAVQERQEHDAGAVIGRFMPGDVVMRVKHSRSKNEPRFEGPYRVARRTAGGSYVLIAEDGDRTCRAPPEHLKLVEEASSQDGSGGHEAGEVVLGHRRIQGVVEYLTSVNDGDQQWQRQEDVDDEAMQVYFQRLEKEWK